MTRSATSPSNRVVVVDNLKSGVTKPHRYEPDINPTYAELAAHYGFAILPARIGKPRDKAKVEVAVQVLERWILARLRHQTFFSLGTKLTSFLTSLAKQASAVCRPNSIDRARTLEALDLEQFFDRSLHVRGETHLYPVRPR